MAIKIYDKYSPRANTADGDYPNGSIKNESIPDANDGTPLDQAWGNDYVGFTDALLAAGGVTPNGLPDTVNDSDRLDALNNIVDDSLGDKLKSLNVTNRLSFNQNWNQIGDTGDPLPSATNTTYVVGNEMASGVAVVSTNIVNATLISGVFNASSGSYQRRYTGEFPDDYFGIRLADGTQVQTGCTLSASGGYTFITVDMSVAPAHLFCGASEQQGIWPVLNIPSTSNHGLGMMGATYRADATFTSADNKIVMNGIVSALGLEHGDVITYDNCDDANNKPHTIESITDDNTVIVNSEHSGDRGNGPLKLVNETVTSANLKLLSKWNVADLGLGQDWVDVKSLRTENVLYYAPKNRTIQVAVSQVLSGNDENALKINGVIVGALDPAGNAGTRASSVNASANASSESSIEFASSEIFTWAESR